MDQAIASVLWVGEKNREVLAIRIIVVDDASTDHTRDIASKRGVECVPNRSTGLSAGRNTGIALATGSYIGFLDDDDVWLEDHAAPHIKILGAQPHVAMVFAQGVLTDSELRPVYSPRPLGRCPMGDPFVYSPKQCPSWNTIIATIDVVKELGGFDESLASNEDWIWTSGWPRAGIVLGSRFLYRSTGRGPPTP